MKTCSCFVPSIGKPQTTPRFSAQSPVHSRKNFVLAQASPDSLHGEEGRRVVVFTKDHDKNGSVQDFAPDSAKSLIFKGVAQHARHSSSGDEGLGPLCFWPSRPHDQL